MSELELLCGDGLVINDKLTINQPTMRQIKEFGEGYYYTLVYMLTVRPYDDKVALDDIGIDYEEVNEYEYFVLSFHKILGLLADVGKPIDFLTHNFDFRNFKMEKSDIHGELILYDKINDIIIDRLIYAQIVDFIRTIHHIPKKNEYSPGNKMMKKRLIDRERRKLKRANNDAKSGSFLAPIISSLTWRSGINVWDMTIFQLLDGIQRLKKIDTYSETMYGVYSGNIDQSKIDFEDIMWMQNLYQDKKPKYNEKDLITK